MHLTGKIPAEELIPLLYGHVEQNSSTLGAAGIRVPGSAGETTHALEQPYGIRSLIMADGPAGIRLHQSYEVDADSGKVYGKSVLGALENGYLEPMQKHENAKTYYQFCTAFPVGTAMAQTWNEELLQSFGRAVSHEMKEFHIDLWLAPGMNIQRNPLCGRNFEYYSEDPLLTGKMGAAMVRGIQSQHIGAAVKHFACNNKETNRKHSDSRVSERALREIYLKAFEIIVKEADPWVIMSAYNMINGHRASENHDLLEGILRDEWHFQGMVTSDWWTRGEHYKEIKAGNDVKMACGFPERVKKAMELGELDRSDLERCAKRVLDLILKID